MATSEPPAIDLDGVDITVDAYLSNKNERSAYDDRITFLLGELLSRGRNDSERAIALKEIQRLRGETLIREGERDSLLDQLFEATRLDYGPSVSPTIV